MRKSFTMKITSCKKDGAAAQQLSANDGRFLILRDLRLQILDLRVQASARGRQLLDRGGQVRDAGLGLGDGSGLLLVVRLAPRQRCNTA